MEMLLVYSLTYFDEGTSDTSFTFRFIPINILGEEDMLLIGSRVHMFNFFFKFF